MGGLLNNQVGACVVGSRADNDFLSCVAHYYEQASSMSGGAGPVRDPKCLAGGGKDGEKEPPPVSGDLKGSSAASSATEKEVEKIAKDNVTDGKNGAKVELSDNGKKLVDSIAGDITNPMIEAARGGVGPNTDGIREEVGDRIKDTAKDVFRIGVPVIEIDGLADKTGLTAVGFTVVETGEQVIGVDKGAAADTAAANHRESRGATPTEQQQTSRENLQTDLKRAFENVIRERSGFGGDSTSTGRITTGGSTPGQGPRWQMGGMPRDDVSGGGFSTGCSSDFDRAKRDLQNCMGPQNSDAWKQKQATQRRFGGKGGAIDPVRDGGGSSLEFRYGSCFVSMAGSNGRLVDRAAGGVAWQINECSVMMCQDGSTCSCRCNGAQCGFSGGSGSGRPGGNNRCNIIQCEPGRTLNPVSCACQ